MKNTRTKPAPRRPHRSRPEASLRTQAAHRRLYTDFLALAFYPGMRPPAPRGPDGSRAVRAVLPV